MRLSGHYKGKIDKSGRIALPATLRNQLGDLAKGTFWITNTNICLEIFPEEEWEKRREESDLLPEMDYDIELFQTFYYDGAHEVKIDGANRVLVPPALREEMGLVKEVMIVGRGRKITIYSASAWRKVSEEAKARFRELQEKARQKLHAVRHGQIDESADAQGGGESGLN